MHILKRVQKVCMSGEGEGERWWGVEGEKKEEEEEGEKEGRSRKGGTKGRLD